MADLYVALLHYPVLDSVGNITPTSLVSLDIHDIARSCITYGVKAYYVVHPVPEMRQLAHDILEYWVSGTGEGFRPDRKLALDRVRVVPTLLDVLSQLDRAGHEAVVVATSARSFAGSVSYDRIADLVHRSGPPVLLLLGTGHGLAHEIMEASDYILRPIRATGAYNHLSVRAAAAIILDRIMGESECSSGGEGDEGYGG